MRVLVVGQGSIGRRHARVLSSLGCEVAVVSQSASADPLVYRDLMTGVASWTPAYIVIANRTAEHRAALQCLCDLGYQGRVLVEKPLFADDAPPPPHRFASLAVGYNLRFHPLLQRLRAALAEAGRVSTASIYVGSYLPDWRPDADYRRVYSASRAQGGGVLRDLSHELDYVHWMFGPWQRLTAAGGHLSALEIDSDDAYTLLLETERCPLVSVHLNYLDRSARRTITVNADGCTFVADVVHGTLSVNGSVESFATERDTTFVAQHRALIAGRDGDACTEAEALATLSTIAAAERAARDHVWVGR